MSNVRYEGTDIRNRLIVQMITKYSFHTVQEKKSYPLFLSAADFTKQAVV